MYTMRRVKMLLLAVMVFFAVASLTMAEDSDAPVVVDEVVEMAEKVKEVVEEAVKEHEPIRETVAEDPPKVEEVKETVVEKPKEVKAAPTSKSSTDGPLASVKSAVCSAADKVISKSKSLLEKTKNISKSDMKKVAAAGLGIWGVAVGVGYLTQPNPAPASTAVKK